MYLQGLKRNFRGLGINCEKYFMLAVLGFCYSYHHVLSSTLWVLIPFETSYRSLLSRNGSDLDCIIEF